MNIAYIVNARIPTEKAHGLQIARVCDALARLGHTVQLVVPDRANDISVDPFSYYGISQTFEIKKLPIVDRGFRIQGASFLRSLVAFKLPKDTIVITRNPEISFVLSMRGYKVFYYAHNWPQSKVWLFTFLLRGVAGIICNSRGTEEEFIVHGFAHTLVVPNAVDMSAFDSLANKVTLRSSLNIPANKKIAMYVGHLYAWKGIDVVIDAARKLSDNTDVLFYIIGGTKSDIEKYQGIVAHENLQNVVLLGHKQHHEVPAYLKAADALLLPNIPSSKESEKYTSPIKMFEYMASGTPIIASDLSSIREILTEKNSTLIPAGDASALVEAIGRVVDGQELVAQKAVNAQQEARSYSWDALARKVADWIGA